MTSLATLLDTHKTYLLGHRGARGEQLENTKAGFIHTQQLSQKSTSYLAKSKLVGIEFDVQLTLDGKLVGFHDENLLRLFSHQSRIDQLTAAQIQRISRSARAEKSDSILLLQQMPKHLKGYSHIELEIKTHERTNYAQLIQSLKQCLVDPNLSSLPLTLTSFDVRLLEQLQADSVLSHFKRGLLVEPTCPQLTIDLMRSPALNPSKRPIIDMKIDIKNAKLNNKVIEQEFKQIIKQDINYSLHMENILKDSLINSKISFLSNLANIYTKKMIFDTKSFLLKSDYKLSVSDLSKLDDFTIIPLSGNIVLDGNIFKDNSSLKVDGFSDLIGGKFKLNLLNNDLNINIDGANSRKLLNMINKNEFFDSKIDLDLKYNLISSYGNLNAKIEDGHFVKTKLTQKIYDLSKIDITKEIYKEGILKSEIKDDKLLSDFHIKADKSIIDSKNGIMDFRKNEIDTKLNVNFNKINFAILLSGNIDNPDYKFDIKDILKDTIKKNINNEKIDKKINRILEKNGVDENKDVQNIIKYLF